MEFQNKGPEYFIVIFVSWSMNKVHNGIPSVVV